MLSGEDMMLSRYSCLITVNKAWQSGISQMTKIDQWHELTLPGHMEFMFM